MEVVKKLAEFVVKTNFEALPQEAVTAAKKALLDTLGVALAGSIEPASKIITGFVKKLGGSAGLRHHRRQAAHILPKRCPGQRRYCPCSGL